MNNLSQTPNEVLNVTDFTFEDVNRDKTGRTLRSHLDGYASQKDTYLNEARRIFADSLESKNIGTLYRSRVLFTLLYNNDGETFEQLYPHIDISDLVKACEMLDAPRLFRQLKRKLEKHRGSKKITSAIKQHINAMSDVLCLDPEFTFSFNYTRVEKIRRWTRQIPTSKLEYIAMMFDTSMWKRLADLCHFHPKHDFQVEWFLRFCFGTEIHEDNVVTAYNRLNLDNFHEIYEKYYSPDFTYEIIRTKIDLKPVKNHGYWSSYVKDSPEVTQLKDRIRETVIQKEGLKTVLWYWDELVTTRNIHNVVARLKEVDNIDLSYGKIADIISKTNDAEILSELVDLATRKSDEFKLDSDTESRVCPVAILCDASSSMEVAIKTSSIIASLLTCATNASLDVFGTDNLHIDNPPRTVEDGVKFGKEMRTRGCTNCASSIGHYYERKQIVNTFIMVTDEEENENWKNMRFDDVYLKYIDEVNPANLIFISFSDPNWDSYMVRNLRKRMDPDLFASLVSVYKFDVRNPDMNRMDLVLRDLQRK